MHNRKTDDNGRQPTIAITTPNQTKRAPVWLVTGSVPRKLARLSFIPAKLGWANWAAVPRTSR